LTFSVLTISEAAHAALYELLHPYNGRSRLLNHPPWNHQPGRNTFETHAALKEDMPLVWTVDFDQNRIFYDRENQHLMYEFSLPEKLPIRLRDFQSYVPMELPTTISRVMSNMCSMDSAPQDVVPEALFSLVYCFASDYEKNWRASGLTIERYGLHHLAMGILSCFTMNFNVWTFPAGQRQGLSNIARSGLRDLVRWRVWPCPQVVPTVTFGATQIIFTDRMDLATQLVHEHFNGVVMDHPYLIRHNKHRLCHLTIHYVVTSIQEIQYFTKTLGKGPAQMTCTPAVTFFDGAHPPSKTGVRWLLNALYKEVYCHVPPLQNLPVEIQEMIIDYACPRYSHNTFDRAIFAAKLGMGVSFNFQKGGRPIVLCALDENGMMIQADGCVYWLRFWDCYAGLTYQVDNSQLQRQLHWSCDGSDIHWNEKFRLYGSR
jgi:hypothetical protein